MVVFRLLEIEWYAPQSRNGNKRGEYGWPAGNLGSRTYGK